MKVIKIIIAITVITLVVLISYGLLNSRINDNDSINLFIKKVSKADKAEFMNYYDNEVRRVVLNKIFDNQNPVCSGNCKEIYGISNSDITFDVLDSGENFEIVYAATDNGKYSALIFNEKDCEKITDTVCSGNVMRNYISKKWMGKGE